MHEDAFNLLTRHADVSRETFGKFILYHDLLLKWQQRVNLVGPDTVREVWSRHFLDSLQLLPQIANKNITLMDIGSGAGFPGMVLAVAGVVDVHLVESDQKKAAFLREVARVTDTKVTLHAKRVEKVKLERVDVITSRACSDLETLLHYSAPNVSHETICLFPKGRNYSNELDDSLKHWFFQYMVLPSATDTQGVVIKLTKLQRRGHAADESKAD